MQKEKERKQNGYVADDSDDFEELNDEIFGYFHGDA
jgi:hypothetical protein